MQDAAPSLEGDAVLRQHGMSVTAQRLSVLRAVSEGPHSTADDVYRMVLADIGAVSRQAVYDALTALTEKGVLRRFQPAGSAARYENRVGDAHHHLICRVCGRIVDVESAGGELAVATEHSGYEIEEAEVVYWGRCPSCATNSASSNTESEESAEERIQRV